MEQHIMVFDRSGNLRASTVEGLPQEAPVDTGDILDSAMVRLLGPEASLFLMTVPTGLHLDEIYYSEEFDMPCFGEARAITATVIASDASRPPLLCCLMSPIAKAA